MAERLTVARLKKLGKNFEISIEPHAAQEFRQGKIQDVREVLQAEHIFSDARKGLLASRQDLQQAFKTAEVNSIAESILRHGEVQETSEQRAEERERKTRAFISLLARQAADARTGLPIPPARIELALEQAKIHLDEHKTVEEQFDSLVAKLRPILPLRIEQKKARLTIPAQYAGKAYGAVKNYCTILSEEWKNDGSWQASIEIPAGLFPEFVEKVSSLTHGQAVIE